MSPQSTTSLIDTAVVTGGAGGIGRAISESLIRSGKKVILVGRTERNLETTARDIGATAYYVLDTGDTAAGKDVAAQIIKDHPDVNCLVNNAGVQRPFQFPGVKDAEYGFDLAKADKEIDINIRGPMHLTAHFLEHFNGLPAGKMGVIINLSSILGFLPYSIINPVYNGTKAWVHMFSMNLRTQMAGRLKVVEIAPPTVSTNLHRERTDPSDNSKNKNKNALSLQEFMQEVERGWEEGRDMIAPGLAGPVVKAWYDTYGSMYEKAVSG